MDSVLHYTMPLLYGLFFASSGTVFELVIAAFIQDKLTTSQLQFGFKKGVGCRDAIFAVNCITFYFCKKGDTVTLKLLVSLISLQY